VVQEGQEGEAAFQGLHNNSKNIDWNLSYSVGSMMPPSTTVTL